MYGSHVKQVQFRLYHMPVLVNLHMVQMLYMTWLYFFVSEAASIWELIPHYCLWFDGYMFYLDMVQGKDDPTYPKQSKWINGGGGVPFSSYWYF